MTRPVTPMLAITAPRLTWPTGGMWVQPKFDGLRCIVDPVAGPMLRSGEPVPCPAVRAALADAALIGLDGELTAPGGLEAAQSAFTGQGAPPAGWRFTAFDDLTAFSQPFARRLEKLRSRAAGLPPFALISPARHAATAADAAEAFAAVVADHRAQDPARDLDGLILRNPRFAYREGRASAHRAELVKIKPMDEGETPILDVAARHDDPDALASVMIHAAGRDQWVPAGLPRAEARRLWSERDGVIGRPAVIRCWGRTGRGALRHAVAVAVRRDLAT